MTKEHYEREFLKLAHKHSSYHRRALANSKLAACFYCLEIYPARAVVEWIPKESPDGDVTGICPECGIDSVLPDHSGLPLNKQFLQAMHDVWFKDV